MHIYMHIPPTINNRIESINHWTNKTDQQSTSKPVGLIVVWFRARHLNSQSNNNWQTVSPSPPISFIKIPTFSISLCKNRIVAIVTNPPLSVSQNVRISIFIFVSFRFCIVFIFHKRMKKNKKEIEKEESYRNGLNRSPCIRLRNRDTLFRKAKKWSQDHSGVVTWRDNLTSWIRALDPIIRQKGRKKWWKRRGKERKVRSETRLLLFISSAMKGDDNLSSTNDVRRLPCRRLIYFSLSWSPRDKWKGRRECKVTAIGSR